MVSAALIGITFTGWALIHTFLASLTAKRWARRVLGMWVGRWYRLFFVVVAVVSLVPILALFVLLPDRLFYAVPAPWRWLMVASQIVAGVLLLLSTLQAGVAHFLGLAQLTAGAPDDTGMLQVRGFYRYVRHPLYLFSLIVMWMTPVMTRSLLVLFAGMSIYLIAGSYHEETLLTHTFGEAYRCYRAQVPRLVPRPGRHFRSFAVCDSV